jgi:nucleoside-diphosphate-sugar epimerase
MKTLIVGASGATGKHLVNQLLDMGHEVKVIVRSTGIIPELWKKNASVSIIEANVSEITEEEMANHIKDCHAVASCLGHNITFKGIYGKPRRLVTDAVRLLCRAIEKNSPAKPVKFVLMNTTANNNRDINELTSLGQKIIFGLIRLLLPPQPDNEKAADFLRMNIGQKNEFIEWVAVRPDSLINQDKVTEYEIYPSPTRSPVFNPGKTSRINAGNFMARLIVENELWEKWKGQMPVIYNKSSQ